MANQNPVEEDWYKLHNKMGCGEFVVEYNNKNTNKKNIKKQEQPKVEQPKVELPKIEQPKIEPKVEPKVEEVVKPKIEIIKEEPPESIVVEVEGDLYHCLPAKVIEHYDELYDERIRKIVYGNQFSLELRKYSGGDIGTKLISSQKIEDKSILFSVREKRWWKVSNCVKQNSVFLISVVPSLEQPSFI
jgi:hypothetical protein